MLKAIFLDVDNTLLDFDAYVVEAMKKGFEKFGLRPYEPWMYPLFEELNSAMWRDLEKGLLSYEELMKGRWNRIFQALEIDYDGVAFERYFKAELCESAILIPGALEILPFLSERYVLCAASNGPYGQQLRRLKLGNLYPYFAHFFISEEMGAAKPKKAFFDLAFSRLNEAQSLKGLPPIQPEETLMLGDSLSSDMQGGLDYGMHTCLFDPKEQHKGCALPVEHRITKLTEILAIL